MNIVHIKDENKELLRDYWKFSRPFCFTYTLKELLKKYGFQSHGSLSNAIKKYGFMYKDHSSFRCSFCKEPYKFYLRNEYLNFTPSLSPRCFECEVLEQESKVIDFYKSNFNDIECFKKIYDANIKNINKNSIDVDVLNLSLLELIYIYIIIDHESPTYFGKLNYVKFNIFLKKEFYMENDILKKLKDKGLIFFNSDMEIKSSFQKIEINLMRLKKHFSNNAIAIINKINSENLDFYYMIKKPEGSSFKSAKDYIYNAIVNYKINMDELSLISDFFEKTRNNEILFINKVVEYNNGLKLIYNNKVYAKFEQVKNNYNLKEIYYYLNNAANLTYYKLDFIPSENRNFMKNIFYRSFLLSNKNKIIFSKKLPGNYRKSSVLNFIQEYYQMECTWENVTPNIFFENLLKRLRDLNFISLS